MFTGIIEETGVIEQICKGERSASITIQGSKVLEDVHLGDSISTNGVCLTVTAFTSKRFTVDVMAETMRRSNLKNLQVGDRVNLERALRVGARLGGHIVTGHIDGTGSIESMEREDNAVWVSIKTEPALLKYVVHKGSIAVDGISLTVAQVDQERMKVSIIPHTKGETTLLSKKVGQEVNLECDILGKYIEKLTMTTQEERNPKGIGLDFLKENGFL